ncbi:hypothetical protein C1646_772574 [Rhizophagus diaphanus]|nr:hypothetical protein C1646_772574 [Rhizophagus diaphanus] [Rhizophagus sp. MUCL 43196]
MTYLDQLINQQTFLEKLRIFIPSQIHIPSYIDEESLSLQIGSNVSINKYNKFLECKVPHGYKFQHDDNGNMFIVDMSNTEHFRLALFLCICFNAYNGGPGSPALNCPIIVSSDTFHSSFVVSFLERRRKIAPDLAIAPNELYVPKPAIFYLNPPPSDRNGNLHARIIVELGNYQSMHSLTKECERPQGRRYRAMTAIFWTQETGRPIPTTGCIAPGLPAYAINIPVNEVFFDLLGIPPPTGYLPVSIPAGIININPGSTFTINLYDIQQEVLMSQRN